MNNSPTPSKNKVYIRACYSLISQSVKNSFKQILFQFDLYKHHRYILLDQLFQCIRLFIQISEYILHVKDIKKDMH